MAFLDRLLGRPLATHEEDEQKVGVFAGIPMLGLDALSSSAYGPEAALTILIPLGALGLVYIGPIIGVILALLTILYFSYRQTIAAYPGGGGSYTVAKENLGTPAGLLAAAALLLDYVMNVAVGISAGMGALISAVPVTASLLAAPVPARAGLCRVYQFARRSRIGTGVRVADLFVCRHTYDCACGGVGQSVDERRASRSGCRGACPARRDGRDYAVAAAARVCQRVYRDDGRGGGQQRRHGLCQTRCRERAAHTDGDCRDSGRFACRDRVSGPRLPHRGDRPGQSRLRQHYFAACGRGCRKGHFLLHHDWQRSRRACAFRQYQFRGLSAPVPTGGAGRFSAPCVCQPGAAARVLLRHRHFDGFRRHFAGRVRRRNGSLDSPFRYRRVSGFCAVTGGHGRALEAGWRREIAGVPVRQRIGLRGHSDCA